MADLMEARRISTNGSGPSHQTFVVELTQFSGPLDLLLSLIRDEQIDISDIPIARVAEQFLARISTLPLDDAAEYLEMAARLLRIKAQMLLPRNELADTWEDPRAELVRRLLEYQQMRQVVDVLDVRAEERRNRFARAFVTEPAAPPAAAPVSLSLGELLAAVDRILRAVRAPTMHDVIPRALDVDGAMANVRAVMAAHARARWTDFLVPASEPWEVLSLLLALLELARRGEVRLAQRSAFAGVDIVREVAADVAASEAA
jgi:segregation and condensation protein A